MPRGRDAELARLGQAIIARLAGKAVARGPDARIRRILDHAAAHLDEPLGLSNAAGLVGLSRHRLRHLFVEQTGLQLRTYLLWLRLTRGLQSYARGSSLTEAAHDAGFSDSAHFSRTFRRMFGTAAAALQLH